MDNLFIVLPLALIFVLLFFFLTKKKTRKKTFAHESEASNLDVLKSENDFLKKQIIQVQNNMLLEKESVKAQRIDLIKKENALTLENEKLKDLLASETDLRKKTLSQKKSSEVRLGSIAETLAPFLDQFDFDPENCIFLGKPIDYISFADDEITFIEVKSGKSQLNSKQRHIRDQVNSKLISWKEVRIK